jgi:transposase
MKHSDFRSLDPRTQEAIRFKAMAALRVGRSKTEVAKLFGVSRQAIHAWVAGQKRSGTQALRSRRRGRPTGGQLTARQEKTMARLIADHCPDQLKLPFYLWTREAVAALITKRFGVRLSVWTVGRLLARLGFTAQQPARTAFEQDSKAVRSWLARRYSPELDPDEYLNQDVKANAVGRMRPIERAELIGNVRAYLRSTQAHRPSVKRYFHATPVRYASG